ncbi:MAG: hypothetical protein WDN46_09945 [Methylocella sp.]
MPANTLNAIVLDQRRKIFRAVLFLIGGILAVFAFGLSAKAAGTHILVIPADDGYGFQDCLTTKSACGLIVANAWCEAHGLKASSAFGRAEDIPATLGEGRPTDLAPGAFLVACGNKN